MRDKIFLGGPGVSNINANNLGSPQTVNTVKLRLETRRRKGGESVDVTLLKNRSDDLVAIVVARADACLTN